MRILLTGAAGQLGFDLRRELAGDELHSFTHAQLDISDRAAVEDAIRSVRPDWVINAAAFNDVDGAERAPQAAQAVNADGPANLAAAALVAGSAIVHVSTDYVFDGRKGSPYSEDDPPNPLSVYGRSKLEGERRVLESGAAACVLRTAWLYGAGGQNFVKAIRAAAARGGPLRVVADQVGSPTASLDLARAIGELVRDSHARGLFHVVNAGACSRYEFARAIVGEEVEVIPITSVEAGRAAARPANASLTSRRWGETGLSPMRSWQSALRAFLETPD